MSSIVQRRKNKSHRWAIWGGLFLLFFLVGLLGRMNWQAWQKEKQIAKRVNNLGRQVKVLQKKKEDFKRKIQEVNQKDYLEKVGREELNLQKPGEKAIAFIALPKKSLEKAPLELNWWQRFWKTVQEFFKR